jgi:hypothetical protein
MASSPDSAEDRPPPPAAPSMVMGPQREQFAVQHQLNRFVEWLERFGETSFDHQSFYAGAIGGAAKALYYRHPALGIAAVAPMVCCEALLPSARRFFHRRMRLPIADAHYAMGFAFLYATSRNVRFFEKMVHFLDELRASRCGNFKEYCWGYPFDWVTRDGTIRAGTPLITTTPYVYEAFLQAYTLVPREDWKQILASIARHACADIKDFRVSEKASSCSYTPFDQGGVINAAAYRTFLLTSASHVLGDRRYWSIAERNMQFVLDTQNADGSWYYAVDGVRDFVDHFHTCFVLKALAKIHSLTGHEKCYRAIARGLEYYLANLFDSDGLPRPFSAAPRMTVYKRELYDCAECINLCLLLQDRFPRLQTTLKTVVTGIIREWSRPDGSFRSRRLHVGWDNVPMHRWGQSQMFRSLAFFLFDSASVRSAGAADTRSRTAPGLVPTV